MPEIPDPSDDDLVIDQVLNGVLTELAALQHDLDSLEIDERLIGDTGEAQENRAIRVAAARSAVERARALRRRVLRVREEVRSSAARALTATPNAGSEDR